MQRAMSLGLDFGTSSVRGVLVDVHTGTEVAVQECPYAHGVVDDNFPEDGHQLPNGWALQDADDYLIAMTEVVSSLGADVGGLTRTDLVGVGVGFTACTVVPCRADGTPLSRDAQLRGNPHAWVKLWKHHGAVPEAERITKLLTEDAPELIERYGGAVSSEWLMPKALELYESAPEIFAEADYLIEAQDWITWQLTGVMTRSASAAGYKALYQPDLKSPSVELLDRLAPRFGAELSSRIKGDLRTPGDTVGTLQVAVAEAMNLPPGVPVATGHLDAQVTGAACGMVEPGRMVLVMGTSVCNLLVGDDLHSVPGMTGAVRDGIIPGLWAYEAGQAAVGDLFGWFVRHYAAVGEDDRAAFARLERGASAIAPGGHGLIALDWWNGNRSVLGDNALSGVIVGMTLSTRPHEMYRALIEAVAFGQRIILETFETNGVPVDDIVACGGLPGKSPLLMQTLADVTGREIQIAEGSQTVAIGAALHGAIAAGRADGGHDTFVEASSAMTRLEDKRYAPNLAARAPYDQLYEIYREIHDYFGHSSSAMKSLKAIKHDHRIDSDAKS